VNLCGLSLPTTVELPDAGGGMCCDGAAFMGPQRCTCWEPVYDLDQVDPDPTAVKLLAAGVQPVTRPAPCHDCAYRPGSPERRGEDGYAGDQELLDRIVATGERFWCHQGMRKVVAYRHPSGVTVPVEVDGYGPPPHRRRPLPRRRHSGRGLRRLGRSAACPGGLQLRRWVVKATRAMPKLSEADWQTQVLELAALYRWTVLHVGDARREVVDHDGGRHLVGDAQAAGLPDLLLIRDRILWRELKTDRGPIRPAQRRILEQLRAAGADAGIWRPRDVDRVVAELRRRGRPTSTASTGGRT
jgi:hypothetical protein